jgi:peptidyl-prolyl cis-trans isomerase B (cyclophilin B)
MRSVKNTIRYRGRVHVTFVLLLLVVAAVLPAGAANAGEPLFARLETGEGNILLVFYPDLAPNHVGNFVHLSRTGYYDGTTFHRIVPGFVIQGGDPNSKDADPRNDGQGGPTMTDVLTEQELELVQEVNALLEAKGYAGIEGPALLKAEFSQTAKHVQGTLSMARNPSGLDTAGSQFFICVANRADLDGKYTIFGHVVTGMDVADIIVNAEKNSAAGRDAPRNPVAIKHVVSMEGVGGLTEEEKAAWDEMPADLKPAQ